MLKVTSAPTACQASGDVYAYFCDYVIKWLELDPSLEQALGKTVDERKAKIFGGGMTIQTTIDPGIAKAAREEILGTGRPREPCTHRVRGGHASTPPPAPSRGMAQSTKYVLNSKNFGETVGQLGRRHQVRRLRRLRVRVDGEGVRPGHRPGAGPPDQHDGQRQAGRSEPGRDVHQRRLPRCVRRPEGRTGLGRPQRRDRRRADDPHPGHGPVDQHGVHRPGRARSGSATCRTTETRMGLHRADGNPISKVGPVGHHPRDPGGLADDRRERLRVAGQQRHPLHADPGPEHHRPRRQGSCRSTSQAPRTARRSSTPRSPTASPAS